MKLETEARTSFGVGFLRKSQGMLVGAPDGRISAPDAPVEKNFMMDHGVFVGSASR